VRRLIVFNLVSLDGFIADASGDMSFAHRDPGDKEWQAFIAANARSGGGLIFGRTTYQMMAAFWPTPQARQVFPEVAKHMARVPKVVFSRSLTTSDWENTRFARGDLAAEIRRLKRGKGKDLAILGSGSIVAQAAQAGLVDEFQLAVHPVVLGAGKSMFAGIADRLPLALAGTRRFKNGNVLLRYTPAPRKGT
jgi:dihydrofolate reductase